LPGNFAAERGPPPHSRAGNKKIRGKIRRFTDDRVLEAVRKLHPIGEQLSLTMPQLALAWVLRQKCVSAAIIGASRPEQIEENVGAVGVALDEEVLRQIGDLLADVARR
jgi:aryl-alcohol dehydrogenase-like predicted oxidoreductase